MLTWRMLKKEKLLTILFFPNGTIQCIGSCEDELTTKVHEYLQNLLNQNLPPWDVRTMTVLCEVNFPCNLRNITSSKEITYEIDLFPAAQMTICSPYHIHVFHNGKVVITGIKDMSCIPKIMNDIKCHLCV